jgi:hypothetical protein
MWEKEMKGKWEKAMKGKERKGISSFLLVLLANACAGLPLYSLLMHVLGYLFIPFCNVTG